MPAHATAYRFFCVSAKGEITSKFGTLTWPAPNGQPGAWVAHEGPVKCCKSGLHASRTVFDALRNRQGETLGRVQLGLVEDEQADKLACRRMRIVELYSRQRIVALAAAAAVLSLPIYENRYPKDARPRRAIEAVVHWLRTGESPAANAVDAATAAAYAATAANAVDAVDAATAAAYAAAAAYAYAAYAADAARVRFHTRFEKLARSLLRVPEAKLANELVRLLAATTRKKG